MQTARPQARSLTSLTAPAALIERGYKGSLTAPSPRSPSGAPTTSRGCAILRAAKRFQGVRRLFLQLEKSACGSVTLRQRCHEYQ
jgi:hypothetical protein